MSTSSTEAKVTEAEAPATTTHSAEASTDEDHRVVAVAVVDTAEPAGAAVTEASSKAAVASTDTSEPAAVARTQTATVAADLGGANDSVDGSPVTPAESTALLAVLAWAGQQSKKSESEETASLAATTTSAPAATSVATPAVAALATVATPTATVATPTATIVAAKSATVATAAPVATVATAVAATTTSVATNLAVTATTATGSQPYGIALYGNRAYVTNLGAGTLSVINTTTNAVVATIAVTSSPAAVAVNKDGTRAYVAGYNAVSVINTATNTVIATVTTGGGQAYGIVLSTKTTRAYVSQSGNNTVVVINTANNTIIARVGVGSSPAGLTLNSACTRLYVSNFAGNTISVVDTFFLWTFQNISVGKSPTSVAINPDNTRLYVTNSVDGTMSVIDTSTNKVTNTYSVGTQPWSLAISPDGKAAYITLADDTVSVVNLQTNAVAATPSIDSAPELGLHSLALSSDGTTIYLTDLADGVLRTISVSATQPTTSSGTSGATTTGTSSTPYLSFDMPTGTSTQKVFAHYVPWMPISFDNLAAAVDYYTTQYLTITGENGIHAAYGGYLRDRPLPRDPIASASWQYLDTLTDVIQAKSVGIDGFTVDISSPTLQDTVIKNLLKAAQSTSGFSIQPQADASSSDIKSMTAAQFAAAFAPYLSSDGVFKLSDGRVVLSAFAAENLSASWWSSALSILKSSYGLNVAFVPTFLNATQNMSSFASISYGFGNWGGRNTVDTDPTITWTGSNVSDIQTAHSLGKIWMQPVAFQDDRPRDGTYQESANSQSNANAWTIAINQHAEWVQLITWNDYAEGTAMAPSVNHGWNMIDLQAYNIAKYKYGITPTILRDTMYVSSRTQFASSKPTYNETKLMQLVSGTPAATDKVEVVVFASAPGSLVAVIGGVTSTCAVSTGRTVCTFDLRAGTISVSLVRNGTVISTVVPTYTVTTTPTVQDLSYHMAGGLR